MLLGGSAAAQIFTEDFNSFTGVLNGNQGGAQGQYITTHDMGHSGNLTGWSKAGAGTVHAVDTANVWTDPSTVTANPQNWGVLIWGGNGVGTNIINEITLAAPIAGSNTSGTPYIIDFLGAGGVYHAAAQGNDGTTDALRIQVLRASDSAVLHTFDQIVAQPVGVGNLGLTPYSFNYTGDGTGDIVFRITGVNDTVSRFQGTIDDLTLSIGAPGAPGVTTFTATPDALGDAGEAVAFDWLVTGLPLDSLVITPGDINVLDDTDGAGVGTHDLDPGPNGTTQYTLTAMKGGDTVTRKVTVTLPAPEITSFAASPSPVTPGEEVTLSWQVELPVTTLTITPGDIDVSGDTGAGSIIVNPTESTIYTLTATRGTSTSTANALAIVQTPPNPNALYFEGFETLTAPPGNFNGAPTGQVTTTHDLVFGASLTGWSGTGGGVIHAVDTHNIWTGGVVSTNPPNWAVMIWQDNAITQWEGIAGSNDAGTPYRIDFLAAGAVYEVAGQVNDGTTDNLLIEVLRASDSAVLHTFNHTPALPVGEGDLGLLPVNFTYTGDGSGDILFRIGPGNADQVRFQGTIDDLSLSVAGPGAAFQITDIVRDPQTLAATITFDSVDGVIYEVWGSPDLQSWQDLDDSVVGTGNSTQFTDSVFAPANLQYYYQVRRP